MKRYKFYKDTDNRWYVDLPDWTGTKADLEMVSGADSMLEYMAEGSDKVEAYISEEYFEGGDLIKLIEILPFEGGGAYYLFEEYRGVQIGLLMWLCNVTVYVFGSFPKNIYICKITY